MAEPSAATQSPSVSSSSSGAEPSAPGSGGSPGACPALGPKSCGSSCADSFVSSSSSQPVSLFSTSQASEICNTAFTALHGGKNQMLGSQPVVAQEGKDCTTLQDATKMEKPQDPGKAVATSPVSVEAGAPWNRPSIPTSFPEHPAPLSKEVDPMEIRKDQESRNPTEVPGRDAKAAVDAEGRFTLLTAQKPPTQPAKAEDICTYSISPTKVLGGGTVEKDSPESPFEVIIDKAAFDREFKDSYEAGTNDFGSWTTPPDGESAADLSETDDKVFPLRSKEGGRYPASALLTRQFSHTTAALEEVSRCVSDMHNFTNEILTWDLVPQVKQDYVTKTAGLDMGDRNSEIPVVNLKTNACQKISICSVNGNSPITKSAGDWAEAPFPQDKADADSPDSLEGGSMTDTQDRVQKRGDTLSDLPGSQLQKCVSLDSGVATMKMALPDDHLKDEMNWQNSVLGEMTEADSSGESDDTVIEDITADKSFESNKIDAEKPVSSPSATVNTNEREIKDIPNCNRENKTRENLEESTSDAEPAQVHPDRLGGRPAGEVAGAQLAGVNVALGGVAQSGGLREAAPGEPVASQGNKAECSLRVAAPVRLDTSCGKSVVKDTDDSSPEDLIAAFTETSEKGLVVKDGGGAFEAIPEQTDLRTALPVEVLHESEAGSSEVKGIRSKFTEQSKETHGSERPFFPMQGSPAASLDLEQEQLTIRALKELGERQVKESASAQNKVESPSVQVPKQTFTFIPEPSQPQRSCDILEHTNDKTEPDLGNSEQPAVVRETTGVDVISSLSKTELANKLVLAGLLANFSVHDLIFWRDVKKTGFVFGTTLIVLLSLAAFSVISVVSYLILALLSVTISFRVYKSVIQAVQKSEEGHPFKAYLDVDMTLSSEAFHNYVNAAMVHINRALKLIIRLFLVEDLVDSLKLAVFMWLMTYVGAVFNGITLLILAELLVFSVPIVYEKYKTQIDHYVGLAREQTKAVVEKIQAKLPGIAKKKAE